MPSPASRNTFIRALCSSAGTIGTTCHTGLCRSRAATRVPDAAIEETDSEVRLLMRSRKKSLEGSGANSGPGY